MRVFTSLRLSALLLLMATGICSQSWAATEQDVRQFVDTISAGVLAVLDTDNLTPDEKQKQLQELFSEHIDTEWMARFVLGYNWSQASEEERASYLNAYRNYLLNRYTSNFKEYSGSNYNITYVRPIADNQFLVGMQIRTPNYHKPIDAGYRLHLSSEGQFKIADIIVEGISLITTQRSEFTSVLKRKGIGSLINGLQAQVMQGRESCYVTRHDNRTRIGLLLSDLWSATEDGRYMLALAVPLTSG